MKNIEIGTDIIDIKRFQNEKYSKDNNFLKKIFTKKELDYCFSKNDFVVHLAGRYAAKEAIVKAFFPLNSDLIPYNEIEILNNEKGLPMVKISKAGLDENIIKISISHDENYAIATAIIYN